MVVRILADNAMAKRTTSCKCNQSLKSRHMHYTHLQLDPPTRALVINFASGVQNSFERTLRRSGISVHSLDSYRRAIEFIERELPFDVVVLDLDRMATASHSLVRRIRAHRYWRHVPIVVLSSGDTPRSMEEAFDSGIDDYIGKSDEPRGALQRLHRHRYR